MRTSVPCAYLDTLCAPRYAVRSSTPARTLVPYTHLGTLCVPRYPVCMYLNTCTDLDTCVYLPTLYVPMYLCVFLYLYGPRHPVCTLVSVRTSVLCTYIDTLCVSRYRVRTSVLCVYVPRYSVCTSVPSVNLPCISLCTYTYLGTLCVRASVQCVYLDTCVYLGSCLCRGSE